MCEQNVVVLTLGEPGNTFFDFGIGQAVVSAIPAIELNREFTDSSVAALFDVQQNPRDIRFYLLVAINLLFSRFSLFDPLSHHITSIGRTQY
ncbi:hypothetical protein D3C80_2012240 [compost metagenome]